ncbi:glutathione peroxidase [Dyadobacter tibetensis]|uniref:glutathione peroxidase n=1 Tax=Dyadobacter tibetensis TaxID=1211851 RepID=UPI000470C925|nr:glutathione peroxidase [Dyadobacter tibetensis]
MKFYDLQATKPDGTMLPMRDLQGKVVLVVNTATRCGLAPQFDEMEALHQRFAPQGLVVLGFPSNQFMNQEPESDAKLEEVCRINHGVTFQLTRKVDVNGAEAHPVFKFLKDELKGTLGNSIKWNFTKFLVGRDGIPFKRYAPTTKPAKIAPDIQKLLEGKL